MGLISKLLGTASKQAMGLSRYLGRHSGETGTDINPTKLRRWETATESTRLNSGQWGNVTGRTINQDLLERWDDLTARCEFELGNNEHATGIVEMHMTDIVGESGPSLQLRVPGPKGADNRYARALEEAWRRWWIMPDLNGELAGVDFLEGCVGSQWTTGDYLMQITDDRTNRRTDLPPTPNGRRRKARQHESNLTLRIHAIHPRRLQSPANKTKGLTTDPQGRTLILGVERNRFGRPLRYWIADNVDTTFAALGDDFFRLMPHDVIHGFRRSEPGQVRGFPWLTTVLAGFSDLRAFDFETLTAARMYARQPQYLYNAEPDTAAKLDIGDTADIEPGLVSALPGGWRMESTIASQPAATYTEFRKARMNDFGRPVAMPGLVSRQDASDHTYSSARFDDRNYRKGVRRNQRGLERRVLVRLLRLVEAEWALTPAGQKAGPRPADMRTTWTWPADPNIDELKETNAARVRIESAITSLEYEQARLGQDPDTVRAQREAAGLPNVPLAFLQLQQAEAKAAAAASASSGSNGTNGAAKPARSRL